MRDKRTDFYRWLCQQRNREDWVGDFARDVFWGKTAPRNSNNPDDWRLYCEERGKRIPAAPIQFEQAWKEYEHEYLDS